MKRRGVPWNPPPVSPWREPFRRYGVVSAELAGKIGYHPPTDPAAERRNEYFFDASPRQREALVNPEGESGCAAESAATVLRGIPKRQSRIVYRLGSRSLKEAYRSADGKRLLSRWSACMAEEGHHYSSPLAAAGDTRWNLDDPRISPVEKQVAVADARCKREVDFLNGMLAIETETQRAMVDKYAKELALVKTENDRQFANVQAVLG